MVFVKKSTFFSYVFSLGTLATKYSFLIFWIEKSASQTGIVKFAKSAKLPQICKGVSRWFLSKINLFPMCVFLGYVDTKGHFLIF